jgi:hypothetical protein
MKIKSSGQHHTLYRYAGTVDGKGTEVKIGVLAVGTAPGEIPADLSDDLTPKEMRELQEHLRRDQMLIARAKLAGLRLEIETISGLVNSENLDEEEAKKMAAALSRMMAAVRRAQRSHKSAPQSSEQVS